MVIGIPTGKDNSPPVDGSVVNDRENAFFRKSNSEAQGVPGFLKHRFGREHLIGSILTMGFMVTSSQVMIAGHKHEDPVRKWTNAANILQNSVFFATERGGNIPQGKSVWGRMAYSLKHPNESSMHFNALTATPISIVQHVNNIQKGLSGNESDQTRIWQGILGVLSSAIVFSGLFRMKQGKITTTLSSHKELPNSQEAMIDQKNDKERHGLSHLHNVARHAWRVDPGGATARTMNAAIQLFMAIEGLDKKRSDVKGGNELIRAAAVQLAMISTQFYYLYDRLLQDSHPAHLSSPAQKSR